jgi:cyanophycinase-like exopeptidase
MKLFLFGGAETDKGEAPALKRLISKALAEIKPKQLLLIPYARIEVPKGEEETWKDGWVPRDLDLQGIEILDARIKNDLMRAKNPVVFMNGGPQRDLLYQKINTNKKLHNLVMNAKYIIGESSGAMIMAEFYPTYRESKPTTANGLGILKNTIIEAHYVQRNRQRALLDEMNECGAKYGVGIDSLAGIIVDTKTFPNKYKFVGDRLVKLITNDSLE